MQDLTYHPVGCAQQDFPTSADQTLQTLAPCAQEWERALKFLGWRAEQAAAGAKTYNEFEQPPVTSASTAVATTPKEDYSRSDPSRPHLTLPFPIPTNELFCFARCVRERLPERVGRGEGGEEQSTLEC